MWSITKSFTWSKENAIVEDEAEEQENLEALLLREEDLEDKFQWTQKEGKITLKHTTKTRKQSTGQEGKRGKQTVGPCP